jgi:hypothetical protein
MEIVVYLHRVNLGRFWSVRGICNVGLWVGVGCYGQVRWHGEVEGVIDIRG